MWVPQETQRRATQLEIASLSTLEQDLRGQLGLSLEPGVATGESFECVSGAPSSRARESLEVVRFDPATFTLRPSRPTQERGKTKGNPKRERGILRLLA